MAPLQGQVKLAAAIHGALLATLCNINLHRTMSTNNIAMILHTTSLRILLDAFPFHHNTPYHHHATLLHTFNCQFNPQVVPTSCVVTEDSSTRVVCQWYKQRP